MNRDEALKIVSDARAKGEQADLSGADLSWADLSGADLREADLSEAGSRYLGHQTPGLAMRHYIDQSQAYPNRPLPPGLE